MSIQLLDNLCLEIIFSFSNIYDITFSLQLICKDWNYIYQLEGFKRNYYCNIFKINEINKLENLLNELLKYLNLKRLIKKRKMNGGISLQNIPIDFNELFKYFTKLEILYSLPLKINYLIKEINDSTNIENNYDKYCESINKLANLTKLERNKLKFYCNFKKFNSKKYSIYLAGIPSLTFLTEKKDIEFEFKDKILKLFKISTINLNKLYLLNYRFKKLEKNKFNDFLGYDESFVEFILFLDNGLPVHVETTLQYSSERDIIRNDIKIFDKIIFSFRQNCLDERTFIDFEYILKLSEILFEMKEEKINIFLEKQQEEELRKVIDWKEFIYGFFYLIFNKNHHELRCTMGFVNEMMKHIPIFEVDYTNRFLYYDF
ncbi:hypothetical protein ABK040_011092 [Willaertia magna]